MKDIPNELVNSKRSKIYKFLINYISEHGYAPTVREIAAGVGIDSTATIYRNLKSLEKMNKIRRGKKVPRSIKIIEMEKAEQMHSNKVKKETCGKCIKRMKETGSFSADQIKMFEEIFYSVSDKCLFKDDV